MWLLIIFLYKGCSKSFKPHPERRIIAEHFCCNNTLTLENFELVLLEVVVCCHHKNVHSRASWGCGIHQMHLCRGVRSPLPLSILDMTLTHLIVRLQSWSFWRMGNTPSLPLLPGQPGFKIVVPIRIPSMVQIELFNTIYLCASKFLMLNRIIRVKLDVVWP